MSQRVHPEWAAPGAHEVAAGVHRIPLPLPGDGLAAANVYAVIGPAGVTLIDAGWAIERARTELVAALDQLGYSLDQVTDVLVTHAHRDHYTMAVVIRREVGCRVSLGAAERVNAESLATRPPCGPIAQTGMLVRAGAARLARAFTVFDRPFDNSDWALPDRWLEHESVVAVSGRSLRVLHTPGHTRGHVAYLDEQAGLLFAGDHVLPHITPSIGFEEVPTRLPLADFLSSLQVLRARADACLLPGHGDIAASVHTRVDELLDHHARRLEATTAAVSRGASTAFEVAALLRWTRRERTLAELDDFNQMLATLETVAHLSLLVERGRMAVTAGSDDVLHYTLPG